MALTLLLEDFSAFMNTSAIGSSLGFCMGFCFLLMGSFSSELLFRLEANFVKLLKIKLISFVKILLCIFVTYLKVEFILTGFFVLFPRDNILRSERAYKPRQISTYEFHAKSNQLEPSQSELEKTLIKSAVQFT